MLSVRGIIKTPSIKTSAVKMSPAKYEAQKDIQIIRASMGFHAQYGILPIVSIHKYQFLGNLIVYLRGMGFVLLLTAAVTPPAIPSGS